jgi:hypothetical protein
MAVVQYLLTPGEHESRSQVPNVAQLLHDSTMTPCTPSVKDNPLSTQRGIRYRE